MSPKKVNFLYCEYFGMSSAKRLFEENKAKQKNATKKILDPKTINLTLFKQNS